jgi:hypothetical protein
MDLINRVKNILLTPKTEWEKIEVEETQPAELTKQYLLPLAVIPAIATFIGFGLIGYRILGVHVGSIGIGIRQAITSLLGTLAGAFLTAFVIDFLATRFESQKNFGQAFKLVVYSYTPMLVAGVLLIIPSLSVLASLCGLYGLYLLYLGLGPLMKTPEEKKNIYFIMSLVVLIAAYAIMGAIMGAIFLTRTHF